MLYNRDGTKKALETALEDLDLRFEKSDFPYLSDILGDDWASTGGINGDPDAFKARAYQLAEVHYTSMYD